MPEQSRYSFPLARWCFALLLIVAGVPLTFGGVLLVGVGGAAYYVLAGVALILAGLLLLRGKSLGAWVFWLTIFGTLAWAIGEVGFDGWMLLPRLTGPFLLAAWFLMPWPRRGLLGKGVPSLPAGFGLIFASIFGGLLAHHILPPLPEDPMFRAGVGTASKVQPVATDSGGEWEHYGRDAGGTRFSPLADINTGNVANLKVAWSFRTGPDRTGAMPPMEVTPLKVGDTLYACTAYSDVIALDAETGRMRWRMRSGADMGQSPYGQCRGVAYYRVPGAANGTACASRILLGTIDSRLLAMDAATGARCQDFGLHGEVSLTEGMGEVGQGYSFVTSAPAVVRGKVVIGGWVADGQYWGEPSGVIRAYDAVSGKLAWAYDAGRPDRRGLPPSGQTYTRSTPNSWAPMSADEALGLVYAPTGNATPDYYGPQRRAFDDQINSAVIALDAETGALRWVFRTVNHDVWDYDVPSQPTLVDLRVRGVVRHALVQPTKRGETFILDRATGEPIYPVTQVPVPQGGKAPGERLSPTQPYSLGLPSVAGPRPVERTMWGITPFDQLWCRIAFRKLRFEGDFTPPGLGQMLENPGTTGAQNWGSVTVDPERNLLITPGLRIGWLIGLMPRDQADRQGIVPYSASSHSNVGGNVAQANTPYAATVAPFFSPLGIPCQSPPYGTMSAIDLGTGKLVWTKRFGTAAHSGPFGIDSHLPFTIGAPWTGGAITTRGGVTFIGGSQDRRLRALETATGRELWSAELPTGGMATPATYRGPSGRQFVVIAAGGHKYIQSPPGDYIIAFALPEARDSRSPRP